MAKKLKRLTEDEFRVLIKHSINEALSEMDGKTFARIHNATITAQRNQVNGIPNNHPKKSNMDVIEQGIRIDPKVADHFIAPYKTDYLFHGQNLRGVASIVIFTLHSLYKISKDEVILKGNVVYNGIPFDGEKSLVINMTNNSVCFQEGRNKPKYYLKVDPSKKNLWDKFVYELHSYIKVEPVGFAQASLH